MTTAEPNSKNSTAAPAVGIPLDRQVRAPVIEGTKENGKCWK